MEFSTITKERYACREFDGAHKVEAEKLNAILTAVQLAPTGRNTQHFKVYVIESEEGLKKANECSDSIYGATTVLLFTYDDRHPESHLSFNDVNVGLVNATIASTTAMYAATEQGLATCYVEAFEGAKTKDAFNLPEGWEPACFMPVGYAIAGPSERHFIRKAVEEITERV